MHVHHKEYSSCHERIIEKSITTKKATDFLLGEDASSCGMRRLEVSHGLLSLL